MKKEVDKSPKCKAQENCIKSPKCKGQENCINSPKCKGQENCINSPKCKGQRLQDPGQKTWLLIYVCEKTSPSQKIGRMTRKTSRMKLDVTRVFSIVDTEFE